jgi:hypothetical protein
MIISRTSRSGLQPVLILASQVPYFEDRHDLVSHRDVIANMEL